jgi:hypothetical protein
MWRQAIVFAISTVVFTSLFLRGTNNNSNGKSNVSEGPSLKPLTVYKLKTTLADLAQQYVQNPANRNTPAVFRDSLADNWAAHKSLPRREWWKREIKHMHNV